MSADLGDTVICWKCIVDEHDAELCDCVQSFSDYYFCEVVGIDAGAYSLECWWQNDDGSHDIVSTD